MCKSPRWAMVLGCLLGTAGLPAVASAQGKVYGLVVVDTRAPGLGEKFLKHDRARIKDVLNRGFPRSLVKVVTFEGNQVTKSAILNHYRDLQPTKNDTVLCYFTGHGETNRKGQHVLQVFGSGSEEKILRSELRTAMRRAGTGPRLVVLWTDACSAKADEGINDEAIKPDKFRPDRVKAGFRRLFFQARGVVDINASEEGTEAACDSMDGGLFTRTLWKCLDDEMDSKTISWVGLYLKLKVKTEDSYKEWKAAVVKKGKRLPPGLARQESQTAFAFYLPSQIGLLVGRHVGGVRVVEVWGDTPASRAEVRRGEIITRMNGKAVGTLKDYDRETDASLASANRRLTLQLTNRAGTSREVTLTLAAP